MGSNKYPRGRMPVSQRAKIFVPFDPLRGFQAALREQERLAEERFGQEAAFSAPTDTIGTTPREHNDVPFEDQDKHDENM